MNMFSPCSMPRPRIVCADGVSLSVQNGFGTYSAPDGSEVEVGFIKDANGEPFTPPESWQPYGDGEFPSTIYPYVPIRLVDEFVSQHGGAK